MWLSFRSIASFSCFLTISSISGQDISGVVRIFEPVNDAGNGPELNNVSPHPFTHGFLFITENDDGVKIEGTLIGIPPGSHGFHVHQNDDLRGDCEAAGPHFNPYGNSHGGPHENERHAGDLGNIIGDQRGLAHISIQAMGLSLHGSNSILGRSLVIHADRDDPGKGGAVESLTTGNSGARIACFVIGIIDQTPPCADIDPDCAPRRHKCTDPRHEMDMLKYCRKTCGFCECRDLCQGCADLAQLCTNPEALNVREECKLTCGLCNCRDIQRECLRLKAFCNDKNIGAHISNSCRRTCGKC